MSETNRTAENRERVIYVVQGCEYRAKRDDNVEDASGFFGDSYRQAKIALDGIIQRMDMEKGKEKPDGCRQGECGDLELNWKVKGTSNNIIAFCAERGNGKTSAMLSFSQALKKVGTKESSAFFEDTVAIHKHQYEIINCIDPTTMESSISILQVVLSRLFDLFRRMPSTMHEERYGSCYPYGAEWDQSRQRLAEQFQKCFHAIEVLRNGKDVNNWPYDELDRVAELGDSTNLRGALYGLIVGYLNFAKGENSEAYLVLQIDDADINVGKTYQILEDIRKYFCLPRVIVLLAANMTQLETTVEQYFLQEYRDGLSHAGQGSMISVERCHEAAELYLEKFVPGSHRIYLPTLENVLTENFIPVRLHYTEPENASGQKPKNLLNGESYQQQLLDLLHRKTGLIFLQPERYLHNFLPSNFRELMHFLAYFVSLEDRPMFEQDVQSIREEMLKENYANVEKRIEEWQKCLDRLEYYLIYIWAASNLRENSRKLLIELANQSRRNKHRFVLHNLPHYYSHECAAAGVWRGISADPEEKCFQEFKQQCREHGIGSGSGTYADVIASLDILTSLSGGSRQYKFVYAVRLYYSIYLHRIILEDIQGIRALMEKQLDKKVKTPERITAKTTLFLRDILFLGWKEQPKVLEHVTVNVENPLELDYGVKSFLRCKKVDHNHYTMFSVNEWDPEDELIFDPFYLLLNEADKFASSHQINTTVEQYSRINSEFDVTMLACMVLTNWDVQFEIQRQLRKISKSSQMTIKEVLLLCWVEIIGEVFHKVCRNQLHMESEDALNNLSKTVKSNESAWFFLQLHTEDKKAAIDYYLEEINAAKKKIHSLFEEVKKLPETHALKTGGWFEYYVQDEQNEEVAKPKDLVSSLNEVSLHLKKCYLKMWRRFVQNDSDLDAISAVCNWGLHEREDVDSKSRRVQINYEAQDKIFDLSMEELCKRMCSELDILSEEIKRQMESPNESSADEELERSKKNSESLPEVDDACMAQFIGKIFCQTLKNGEISIRIAVDKELGK